MCFLVDLSIHFEATTIKYILIGCLHATQLSFFIYKMILNIICGPFQFQVKYLIPCTGHYMALLLLHKSVACSFCHRLMHTIFFYSSHICSESGTIYLMVSPFHVIIRLFVGNFASMCVLRVRSRKNNRNNIRHDMCVCVSVCS